MAWYRLPVTLDPHSRYFEHATERLAVRIGKVMDAYELYAGGELLGGVGQLPPQAGVNYDTEAVYAVPRSAVADDGTLVLALRVWGGNATDRQAFGGGPYLGDFLLGDYGELLTEQLHADLPMLIFCALFMGFGLYHIYLYRRNKQLGTYLWFGLMAVLICIYGLMLTDWKQVLGWPFALYEKVEFTAIYILPAITIQMLWSILGEPVGRLLRAYQWSFVLLAFVAAAVPGLEILQLSLDYFQAWCIPLLLLIPVQVAMRAAQGHREARTLLFGVLVFTAFCINDILIDMARIESMRLLPFGFAAVMVSMAVSLGNRFTDMLNDLERKVEERTAELADANAHLSRAALIDSLTGVYNRRGFTELAREELQRALRSGRGFSVVLVDIDRFKAFNDSWGHACGDHVLQRAARLFIQQSRDIDRVGRWGGEEFILLLPETRESGAAALAERLRSALARNIFEFEGERVNVTATFGIASHRPGEILEHCIARADAAMYRGKDRGRNCVSVASPARLKVVT
jgi:diguanylate cyclase (GGDEF)-like protein